MLLAATNRDLALSRPDQVIFASHRSGRPHLSQFLLYATPSQQTTHCLRRSSWRCADQKDLARAKLFVALTAPTSIIIWLHNGILIATFDNDLLLDIRILTLTLQCTRCQPNILKLRMPYFGLHFLHV